MYLANYVLYNLNKYYNECFEKLRNKKRKSMIARKISNGQIILLFLRDPLADIYPEC